MPLRVTFVLPGRAPEHSGGIKVVYEYANRLAKRGHRITLVHPAYLMQGSRVLRKAKGALSFLLGVWRLRQWRPDAWFSIDQGAKMLWVPNLSSRWIPDADAVVASAWQTAEWVQAYGSEKGVKLYLIHDYEHYMVADPIIRRRMAATYAAGMYNIVTSPAGVEMLKSCGAPVGIYIPNGLNLDIYGRETDISDKSRVSIGFPTRPEVFKGSVDAVCAIEIVRSKCGASPGVWSFGRRHLGFIPDWVRFYKRPSDEMLCRLYNKSMIFVLPSHYEGWGLSGSEAMACGAALVSTDNGGVQAYAKHGATALLSPIKDPAALADNILKLIHDSELRIKIATQGYSSIQQFTWDRSVNAFEKWLLERV